MSTEDYADRLVHRAMRIVATVHDEGPDAVLAAINHALSLTPPPDVEPVTALTVTLAAMIDPTKTASALLLWTLPVGGELQRLRNAGVNNNVAAVLAKQAQLPAKAAVAPVGRGTR